MQRALSILPLFVLLVAAGCSPATMIEKLADDAKEKIAQDYLHRVVDGDLLALAGELDPKLRTGSELAQLQEVRKIFPAGSPTVTNLVGYFWHKQIGGQPEYNLTYQFGYGSKWILANVAWRELPNGTREIISLRAQSLPASLQETNALSFKHAGLLHYIFVAAAIAIPIFIVVTLVACLRTKLPRRKWLWILFILAGLTKFSLNWTTGETDFSMLVVQLLGVGAYAASIYSPWTISVSLPVGATLFWFKRRALARPLAMTSPSSPPVSPP